MSGDDSYELLIVDPEEVNYLRQIAEEYGVVVEELPRRGVEPVTTIAFAIAGAAFAVASVVHLLERQRGGQVVDLRSGAPRAVYRSNEVGYGLVIIITQDGTVEVAVREPKGMFGHVNDLILGLVGELSGKNVAAVSEIVQGQITGEIAAVTSVGGVGGH